MSTKITLSPQVPTQATVTTVASSNPNSPIDSKSTKPFISKPVSTRPGPSRGRTSNRPRLPTRPVYLSFSTARFLITDAPTDNLMPVYIHELKRKHVKHVVRLCEPTYDTAPLIAEGINVIDMPFIEENDIAAPKSIIRQWIKLIYEIFPKFGVVDVHGGSDQKDDSTPDEPAEPVSSVPHSQGTTCSQCAQCISKSLGKQEKIPLPPIIDEHSAAPHETAHAESINDAPTVQVIQTQTPPESNNSTMTTIHSSQTSQISLSKEMKDSEQEEREKNMTGNGMADSPKTVPPSVSFSTKKVTVRAYDPSQSTDAPIGASGASYSVPRSALRQTSNQAHGTSLSSQIDSSTTFSLSRSNANNHDMSTSLMNTSIYDSCMMCASVVAQVGYHPIPSTSAVVPKTQPNTATTNSGEEKITIAVHCVSGVSRAPFFIAIALMEAGFYLDEALTICRDKKKGSISTAQVDFLLHYHRRGNPSLRTKKKKSSSVDGCCTVM